MAEAAVNMTISATRHGRFVEFVEAHRDRAIRLAWQLLGHDRAAAEDLAQQAFLKAWDYLPRFRDESSLETWFTRILVNQVRSKQRWLSVRQKAASLLGVHFERPAHTTGSDHVLQGRLLDALQNLSDGQREALVLVHLEGFSITEVAKITGRAPGTIKSHLHRALKRLRSDLKDVWEAYK